MSRRLLVALASAAVGLAVSLAAADAAGSARPGFHWFAPAPAPAAWQQTALPSGGATLSYPRTFVAGGDKDGIARERVDSHGTVLVYLDATPKQGPEQLGTWPAYRLAVVRKESKDVREDGHAYRLRFRGGSGSCVLDDYVTKVKNHHYREIACYVQGGGHASVLIAAALQSRWAGATKTLRRAVDAYRVG